MSEFKKGMVVKVLDPAGTFGIDRGELVEVDVVDYTTDDHLKETFGEKVVNSDLFKEQLTDAVSVKGGQWAVVSQYIPKSQLQIDWE